MMFQRRNAISKFCFADEAFRYDAVAKIVCKLQQDRPTAVVRSISMDQRIDPNIDQARIAQHPGNSSAEVQVDPFRFGEGNKSLFKTVHAGSGGSQTCARQRWRKRNSCARGDRFLKIDIPSLTKSHAKDQRSR